jgi:hypothetical protein
MSHVAGIAETGDLYPSGSNARHQGLSLGVISDCAAMKAQVNFLVCQFSTVKQEAMEWECLRRYAPRITAL